LSHKLKFAQLRQTAGLGFFLDNNYAIDIVLTAPPPETSELLLEEEEKDSEDDDEASSELEEEISAPQLTSHSEAEYGPPKTMWIE